MKKITSMRELLSTEIGEEVDCVVKGYYAGEEERIVGGRCCRRVVDSPIIIAKKPGFIEKSTIIHVSPPKKREITGWAYTSQIIPEDKNYTKYLNLIKRRKR